MKKVTNACNKAIGPHSVVALVYDGLCTFEYGIAAEVFSLARPELKRPLYQFSTVAMEKGTLHAAGGLAFQATGTLEDLNKAHTIVIPGWRGKDVPVPESVCRSLRRAYQRGVRMLAICSGGYVLASAGLLDNKRATTHWQYAEHFSHQFPEIEVIENSLYIDDDNIVTSAGSSAGIDACLHVVRCDYGAKIASVVARRLVMHSYRQGSQAQFTDQPVVKSGDDQRISKLMDKIKRDLSTPYKIATMANTGTCFPVIPAP